MRNPTLFLHELAIYSLVYFFYTLLAFVVFSFFGPMINGGKVKEEAESNNVQCLAQNYGENNIVYTFINNIFDFVSAFIPSKNTLLLFLFIAYVIYLIFVAYIKEKKPSMNSNVIYAANAFGSIGKGLNSLVYFITATLCIFNFFLITFVHECLADMKSVVGVMMLVYIICSTIFFWLDYKTSYILNNFSKPEPILGLKNNKKKWYRFGRPDHF